MNLQQLQYIVAVDDHRHFADAAKACFVTQPTLSMMIHKLEDELDTTLFDRSKQPVVPTDIGAKVIAQARVVLRETGRITDILQAEKQEVKGSLKLGIIPTLAPYLLPLFVKQFMQQYPAVELLISELTTDTIIGKLKHDQLDAALLATPLNDRDLLEHPLFYEKFLVYADGDEIKKLPAAIDPIDLQGENLWLLDEGHCFGVQLGNLCKLQEADESRHFHYRAGSIETLIQMVDRVGGITVIPELSTPHLTEAAKKRLRQFTQPSPVREVSLVTYRHFAKKHMLEALKDTLTSHLPSYILANQPDGMVEF